MKKIYITALLPLYCTLQLMAMEQANAIFKQMTKISFDATQPHAMCYSAHSSGKILHAQRSDKINGILIEIENENNLKTILHDMNKDESAQIYNFLSYTLVKKQRERRDNKNTFCVKGSESVEPQEMPKDFKKDLLDAYTETIWNEQV